MGYKLRPYQIEAVDIAVAKLKSSVDKPFIVVAATGAGKSLIIAEICHQLDAPVLILQPSKEILEQNYSKLKAYGIKDISIYSASIGQKEIDKFTYATIGSIYKKPELFKHFRYVIIDECHGVNPKQLQTMYGQFLSAIGCRNVLGLTATPYRIQGSYMYEGTNMYYTSVLKMINRIAHQKNGRYETFWKDIVFSIETDELIQQGYLSPIRYYRDNADLSELVVNTTGADFTTESLERYWNNKRLRRIAQALQWADTHHERSLTFCSSIRQATTASELAGSLGIKNMVVSSQTPKKTREEAVRAFKEGKLKHLLNVGVFTVGFDAPKLDCIVLARPTMSLALYYQMIGRGVRLDPDKPDKVLHVYDLAGVVEKMGRVETIKLAKEEKEGFRPDIITTEFGRADGQELFKYFIKNKPKHLASEPTQPPLDLA